MRHDMFNNLLGSSSEIGFLSLIDLVIPLIVIFVIAEGINYTIHRFKRSKNSKFKWLSREFAFTFVLLAALLIYGFVFFGGERTMNFLAIFESILFYPLWLFAQLYKKIVSPY